MRLTQDELKILDTILLDMQNRRIQTTTQQEIPWAANCTKWTIVGYMWKLVHNNTHFNSAQTITNLMDVCTSCVQTKWPDDDIVTATTAYGIDAVRQVIADCVKDIEVYEPIVR